MHKVQLSVLVALMSLFLVTLTQSAALSDDVSSRNKRQSADVRTAEYLAWIALGGKLPSRGCERVACGVVDVYSSSRIKRQFSEVRAAEYLAQMAQGGQIRRCVKVGCGVVDIYASGKRKRGDSQSVSDEERYNILRALVQRAALESASS